MHIFLTAFFLILFLRVENAWAQDDQDSLLAWQIPQTLPTSEDLLDDDGSALPQSGGGASLLLAQVDQQQYPNSLIDPAPAKADGSWDSPNEISDCLSDDNNSIQGRAASSSALLQ